ncbi:hypothetical protein C8024_07640 [Sphingopyxis sp. BSNA05]|uniref:response regulator n=1 Tax=Sphingopyxis sp. BSNA05 TaxID=1236614 RepID=UPI001DE468E5|nr:response regulator [Sphingopyxis sp. BSNA05]NRD89345.1 hypothetical protein [Sphingopyxis sp. BSNA05]
MMQNNHPIEPAVVKILVVDDVEANRALLCRRLGKAGFVAAAVDSGMAALQSIEESLPDIVLLDYMMPTMNGVEVLKQLRDRDATKSLPVIMVTARTEGEAVVEALSAGADDYVTKPIDFEVLCARMESQLSKNRTRWKSGAPTMFWTNASSFAAWRWPTSRTSCRTRLPDGAGWKRSWPL